MGGPEPGQSPSASDTVSRGAFFSGIVAGTLVGALGFYGVPVLGLPSWLEVLAEIATVAVALGVTTGVWRLSARAGSSRDSLDTSEGTPDRKGS